MITFFIRALPEVYPFMGFALTDNPGGYLQILGVRRFRNSVIDIIAQIMGNTLHTPYKVGIGVGHVDANPSGKVAKPSDVRMPGMRNGVPFVIVSQETEYRRTVHGRIPIGNINTHQIARSKDRAISDAPLTKVLQIVNTTDALELITDQIACRQSISIATDHLQLDVTPILQAFFQLSPLIQQTPVAPDELLVGISFTLSHPGNGSGIKNTLSPFCTL